MNKNQAIIDDLEAALKPFAEAYEQTMGESYPSNEAICDYVCRNVVDSHDFEKAYNAYMASRGYKKHMRR